jgi:hypothetical protein
MQEWAHEDPWCAPHLEKMFDNHEDYWNCADPLYEDKHPPCAKEWHTEIGHDHPSGLPTAVEHPVGKDALCMIEYQCSDGWDNWGEHVDQCVCDHFLMGDEEQFMDSWNYWWVNDMCHASHDDHHNDEHHHDEQYADGTDEEDWTPEGTDADWYLTQIKKAQLMHKNSPAAAKRFIQAAGLKRKGTKQLFRPKP